MKTCDPLKARKKFKRMVRMNWLAAVVLFIPLVFILQIKIPYFFTDAIAIGIVFCVFFYFLRKRTIAIQCPRCENIIETNTPWKCGVCGKTNLRVYDYPFVGHCENEHCRCEPKAYKCHHKLCGALIYFSADKSELNYAQSLNANEKPVPPPMPPPVEEPKIKKDGFAEAVVKRERSIKLKGLDVKEAELDVVLKGLKDQLTPIKPRSLKERLRSGVFSKSELDDEVRKMMAEADIELAGDDAARERRHAVIEAEARELM